MTPRALALAVALAVVLYALGTWAGFQTIKRVTSLYQVS